MSEASDIRQMLVDSAKRLFADHVDGKLLTAAKQAGWSAALWDELEAAELPRVGVPEDVDGSGGSLSDAAAVLRIAARHAAPVPLAETMLAGWLLAGAGLRVPNAPLTVAPVLSNDAISVVKEGSIWRVNGALRRVPFARMAKQIVLLKDKHVFTIDTTQARITPGRNLASDARDDVQLNNVAASSAAPTAATQGALIARGALLRTVQIGGALERALELACEYAKQREQFGRKIAQFQALQQDLARCGGEVAACVAAALSAVGIVERGGDEQAALLAMASAKVRASDAAREAVAIAHQVHGAIGVTDEYELHHLTLRALAWREEFGNEVYWARHIGCAVRQAGADAYWATLNAI